MKGLAFADQRLEEFSPGVPLDLLRQELEGHVPADARRFGRAPEPWRHGNSYARRFDTVLPFSRSWKDAHGHIPSGTPADPFIVEP